jgi:hypothetical protein
MREGSYSIDEYLQTIDETVLPRNMRGLNYNDYMTLAVGLCKESSLLLSTLIQITPSEGGWSRNDAIIIGHFTRLFKLISAQLDQTCKGRQEIAWLFSRLIFECIVNTKYLIGQSDPKRFDEYVRYSLYQERDLKLLINKNIAERNGKALPIESRMLESIERCVSKSGVKLDELTERKPKSWAEKSLHERSKVVDLDNLYIAFVGGTSHSIHGNWMDILNFHLEEKEDKFVPKMSWSSPQPQLLLSTAFLCTQLSIDFLRSIDIPPGHALHDRLLKLLKKTITVDMSHEASIQ